MSVSFHDSSPTLPVFLNVDTILSFYKEQVNLVSQENHNKYIKISSDFMGVSPETVSIVHICIILVIYLYQAVPSHQ